MKRLISPLTVVLVALACTEAPTEIEAPGPRFDISDAVHDSGNEHFFWLPPLVSEPTVGGVFDGSLAPTVEICDLGAVDPSQVGPETPCSAPAGEFPLTYTTTSGPGSETVRVSAPDEHYITDWHTDEFELSVDHVYRIRVLVAGTSLGHADVDVVNSGKDLKNVQTDEFIALKDGRTLPIKFRIEEGAVFALGSGGGTITAEDGAVTLDVPPGALSSDVGITIEPDVAHPPEEGIIPGAGYEFGPDGLVFDQPVSLTIVYDEGNLPAGFPETGLTLATQLHEQGGVWRQIPSSVDAASNEVTGSITGFSNHDVQKAVASVDVSPASASLAIASGVQLTATPYDADGAPLVNQEITWGTSDPGVATVDAAGLVTGVASGTATITAVAGGVSGAASVTVGGGGAFAEIDAILGDVYAAELVAGLTTTERSTMEATLDQCSTAISQSDTTALSNCLATARGQVAAATDPTDRALLAVLDRFLDTSERLLNP